MDKAKIFKYVSMTLFLGAALWLFRGGFSSGTVLAGDDTLMLDMPFRMLAKDAFMLYHALPLWMPQIFLGMPLLDSANLIYFYPVNFILMLLPLPVYSTYVIDIIIHMLIAALGMFLFLKERGLKKEASLFGAFVFMLSGIMVSYVNVGHWGNIKAAALIPFVFYFLSKGVKRRRVFDFASAALFFAMQILCVGMQIMAYTALAALFYIIYELFFVQAPRDKKIFIGLSFALTGIALIFFSALQFVPSLDYMKYAWRGKMTFAEFTSWSLHPAETLTFILPQFFGLMRETYWGFMQFNMATYYFGILPFLLLPFAYISGRDKKFVFFMSACALIFLILGYGGYTPFYGIFYHVPIFNNFRTPSRFLYLFTFFITVLASFGLNNIMQNFEAASEKKDRQKSPLFEMWWKLAALTGGLTLAILAMTSESTLIRQLPAWFEAVTKRRPAAEIFPQLVIMMQTDGFVFFGTAAAFLLTIVLAIRKKLITSAALLVFVVCVLHFADINRVQSKFINVRALDEFFPANDPIAEYMNANVKNTSRLLDMHYAWTPNKGIYYGIESAGGYHGNLPSAVNNFLQSNALSNLNAGRVMNIGYYMSRQEFNIPEFEKVVDGSIKLYKDAGVFPKFYVLDRVKEFNTSREIPEFMKTAAFDPKTALTSDSMEFKETPEKLNAQVKVLLYSPGNIRLEVNTNKESVLVAAISFYHRWKVKVDNKPEKLYNVNYLISGVKLPPGKHEVRLYYPAGYLVFPALLTLLALIFYVILYFYERKKNKNAGK